MTNNLQYEEHLGATTMASLVFRMAVPAVVAQLVNGGAAPPDGVRGVFAAEAISDATAAVCCTVLSVIMFPKILRKNCPSS